MGNKTEYKSSIRSKKQIKNAVITLMQTKCVDKISVKEIAETAGINRGTFYAHYIDVKEVGNEICDDIVNTIVRLLGEFPPQDLINNPLPLLMELSRIMEADIPYFRNLFRVKGSDVFKDKLKTLFMEKVFEADNGLHNYKDNEDFALAVNFCVTGIIGAYYKWFYDEIAMPLPELTKRISAYTAACLKAVEL